MPLLGPNGQPISSGSSPRNKKAASPPLGNAFGQWAGRDLEFLTLPGGGVVQFDLNKLTLADYRTMRDHYQVNSSLSVLSFMQHQCDWHIQGSTTQINQACELQLKNVWTDLNRALSQANWAGFSPSVLQWENDPISGQVVLDKVKDLIPEECLVKWAFVDQWAPPGVIPPKTKVFDGIIQLGASYPIPVGNAFWYPILMENGNYRGRKLLRAAFPSYFFSFLLHLFSNRYYERFGEPVPIGRAPFDEMIDIEDADGNTTQMRSTDYMLGQMQNLRSRSVVSLPADRSQDDAGRGYFDYDITYLESQMRGADFERYMSRLDEEISLALFTPILLTSTADVGSYSLGDIHMQVYLNMLNAMNDDRAKYIDKYILSPMVDVNFSPNAPRPHIVFRKLGNTTQQTLQSVLTALIQNQMAKPNLDQLGEMVGMDLVAIRQTVNPEPTPADPSETDGTTQNDNVASNISRAAKHVDNYSPMIRVASAICDRVKRQVSNAFAKSEYGSDFKINMGYKKQMLMAMVDSQTREPRNSVELFYDTMNLWNEDVCSLGTGFVKSPEEFMTRFSNELSEQLIQAADIK